MSAKGKGKKEVKAKVEKKEKASKVKAGGVHVKLFNKWWVAASVQRRRLAATGGSGGASGRGISRLHGADNGSCLRVGRIGPLRT
jgi:hypothetical protein